MKAYEIALRPKVLLDGKGRTQTFYFSLFFIACWLEIEILLLQVASGNQSPLFSLGFVLFIICSTSE